MTPEERAYAAATVDPVAEPAIRRRLSPWRVLGLVLILAAATAGALAVRSRSDSHPQAAAPRPTFMPYVDVTTSPEYHFEDVARPRSADLVLSFVVSTPGAACEPSWGAKYSLSTAAGSLDLDRRIARLRQRGGHVTVSFGGAAHTELAVRCTDPAQLLAAYRDVVQRYGLDAIDLDVEGDAASAPAAAARRAHAVRQLQDERAAAGRSLQVWLTLPVDRSGLTATGKSVLARTLAAGVRVTGVNALTMDYGNPSAARTGLDTTSTGALTHLADQVASAYRAAGIRLSTAQVWSHIGATPMIGQNDVAAERFELANARTLLTFARAHEMRRLSMWSLNRDQGCGPNYANVSVVSTDCSGVSQARGAFAALLGTFSGKSATATAAAPSGTAPRTAGSGTTSVTDDPATSPYAIWNPDRSYPAGTKIVWHRNVYQAKWWTQGDTPDAPVASAADTPWTLIGPVLPGEHPQPTPTLAAGTYPAWSPTTVYRAGDRVLYQHVGYQAKWYTKGDTPGITVNDPGQTPWEALSHP
jgi:chitinase